jgi:hypothetical protein
MKELKVILYQKLERDNKTFLLYNECLKMIRW